MTNDLIALFDSTLCLSLFAMYLHVLAQNLKETVEKREEAELEGKSSKTLLIGTNLETVRAIDNLEGETESKRIPCSSLECCTGAGRKR